MEYHHSSVQLDHFPDSFNRNVLGQEYSNINNVLVDGGNHYGVSALHFDTQEELLWMGNRGGHVTSYYTSALQKYTSFQVHTSNEILQLLSVDAGILSLTSNLIKLHNRRGLPMYSFLSPNMTNMQCMTMVDNAKLIVGGPQNTLVCLDMVTSQEEAAVQIGNSGCAILRQHPRFICAGDFDGKVTLRDPNSLSVEHTFDAHTGTLSDFDVHGNLLVTCGFSSRNGGLNCDRLLMVYDVRTLKNLTPIQTMFSPFLLRFLPAFSSRLCVVSDVGQFQLMDVSTTVPMFPHQVDTGGRQILCFDTSSSSQALSFGDNGGYLHLYGASDNINFNGYSRTPEFADTVEPLHHIDFMDELTPASTVPMPHCNGKLFSDWPPELLKVVYRRTPPIDAQVLNSMKMVGSIGHAPNPATRLRNQMPYQQSLKLTKDSLPSSPSEEEDLVPQHYLKIELRATKQAYEEIDFNRYNRTSFAGLEANLPNSYSNNMIQVLYYIEPLRAALISHQCEKEFCLSCELGFLFHMLDTAQGLPCQANNFLRAFRTIPEASALGLTVTDLNEARKKCNLSRLVQSWTCFILQQISAETERTQEQDYIDMVKKPKESLIVESVFGGNTVRIVTCRCGFETSKNSLSFLCPLASPDITKSSGQFTFGEILKKSLSYEQSIQAWCEKCDKFQYAHISRRYLDIPDNLVITCGLDKPQVQTFWKYQLGLYSDFEENNTMAKILSEGSALGKKACRYGAQCARVDCKFYHNRPLMASKQNGSWIPSKLSVKVIEGQVFVEDVQDGIEEGPDVFELTGIVSVVTDLKDQGRDNIVSCIKVGPKYHTRMKGSPISQWYLFNDFCITPISQEEALFQNLDWKSPCVIYFSRAHSTSSHSVEIINGITSQVFREDVSLASRTQSHISFTPLSPDENPKIVAMDAEFVTLNQEEAEIRSDGTRSTIKPGHFSVARISCVRGDGHLEGLPFIDDYISTQEQIVDYVTKFSGIQPGDLDATVSSKHLTTLKSTYLKLRYLVDTGVKFVGHGLKNDFRVINLVVPPEQVLDTVHLFQIPNKRMVSLRFLAWHFLDLRIQSETHDSIEDAKTALQLYKKYQQLEEEGQVKEALKKLYEMGRNLQWQVPESK